MNPQDLPEDQDEGKNMISLRSLKNALRIGESLTAVPWSKRLYQTTVHSVSKPVCTTSSIPRVLHRLDGQVSNVVLTDVECFTKDCIFSTGKAIQNNDIHTLIKY